MHSWNVHAFTCEKEQKNEAGKKSIENVKMSAKSEKKMCGLTLKMVAWLNALDLIGMWSNCLDFRWQLINENYLGVVIGVKTRSTPSSVCHLPGF